MAKIQSAGSVAGKETIYVDVDDEITSIIDKVQLAKGKIVALVLPKRSPVLQSIVNMKLLKRTADNAGKNLVLVTSEPGLLPLAGAVGLHVASTPTGKPSIPAAPVGPDDEAEEIDEPLNIVDGNADPNEEFDARAVAGKPVGELAAAGAVSKLSADDVDESIDMGEDAEDPVSDSIDKLTQKPAKDKKLKIPNFDSFRKKIALAILGVAVLVTAWIFAFIVLPKATVTIHTDSSTITTDLNLSLDASVKTLDTANNIVPATSLSQSKTATQQVPATGQQNNGTKATGKVTVSAGTCGPNFPNDISAGTSLSTSGHTYTFDTSVMFVTHNSGGHCTFVGVDSNNNSQISITALKGGADYNLTGSFTVSGRSDVTTSGSATGGTDNITKIVQQSDIDNATSKISSTDVSSVKQQLASNLQTKGLQPIATTFVAGTPQVTSSAQAGDAADTVTVTSVTAYTMLGVQKSDLQKLVDNKVNGQLDKGKQVILDDGVANATFAEPNPATATSAAVSMQAKSLAGPQLNVPQLKTQLAGKKSGDVKKFIKQTPGVTDVDVKYSPFWVSVVPKNTSKVTVVIDKAGD